MNKQQKTMATARAALDEMGLRFGEANDSMLYFGAATGSDYRDTEGQDLIRVHVSVEEDGACVRLVMPRLYVVPAGHQHLGVFMTAAAAMMYRWRMIRYGWDTFDGEVRMEIDLPIMDGELTANQIKRALTCLVQAAVENHGVFVRALEEGVYLPERPEEGMLRALEMLRAQLLAQIAVGQESPDGPGFANLGADAGTTEAGDEEAELRKLAAILSA